MSQSVHVPKFGNWDREDIPITAYFENARKDKGGRSKIFNPNDPEENPDAFSFTQEHGHRKNNNIDNSSDYGSVNSVSASSEKSMHSVKQSHMQNHCRDDGGGYMETPTPHSSASQRTSLDPHWSRNSRISNSEPNSEKSICDHLHPSCLHHHRSSKSSSEGGYSFSASRSLLQAGNTGQGEAQLHRVPSVPKFGDWDETDPKSAEGFTAIFEQLKEDKHSVNASLSTVSNESMLYLNKGRKHRNSSMFKKACCIFAAAND